MKLVNNVFPRGIQKAMSLEIWMQIIYGKVHILIMKNYLDNKTQQTKLKCTWGNNKQNFAIPQLKDIVELKFRDNEFNQR